MGFKVNGYKVISYSSTDPALVPFRNLIYASFLNGLRFNNDLFKDIESGVYYHNYHHVIDGLLSRVDCVVRLAVLDDDPDTAVGWSISEGHTLHFVFVKGDIEARKHGIGTSLLPEGFNKFTHLTKIGRVIWKNKYPEAIFNPFL
jgi:hypothetical protein